MTIKFCVVGSPISHSLSPLLHRAAADYLGLDFSYEAKEVFKGDLARFLERGDYQGVSVTMPLKAEAFELSKLPSESSSLTRVANTLTRSSAGWACANTDVFGLTQALLEVPKPKRSVIIGSGATTVSALTAFASLFPNSDIQIMARDNAAASEIVVFGKALGLSVSVAAMASAPIVSADLVLSLVPKDSFAELWKQVLEANQAPLGWLFDVSYSPWPSLPVASWGSSKVISGLEMLIWQATEQVEIFSRSLGQQQGVPRQELYRVMKAAVSSK